MIFLCDKLLKDRPLERLGDTEPTESGYFEQ
jgi:hypothetical protein